MDFSALYEESKTKLERLNIEVAQLKGEIKALVEELQLDSSKDLNEQVEALKKSLEEQQAKVEGELQELQLKLQQL